MSRDMPGYDGRGASKALELAVRRMLSAPYALTMIGRAGALDAMLDAQLEREQHQSAEAAE